MHLLAFKLFLNTAARVQVRKSRLSLQQRNLMNITAKTNKKSTVPVNGGKEVFFNIHMFHAQSENAV